MSPHVSTRHKLLVIKFYTFYLQKQAKKHLTMLIIKHLCKRGKTVTGLLTTLFESDRKLTPYQLKEKTLLVDVIEKSKVLASSRRG